MTNPEYEKLKVKSGDVISADNINRACAGCTNPPHKAGAPLRLGLEHPEQLAPLLAEGVLLRGVAPPGLLL